ERVGVLLAPGPHVAPPRVLAPVLTGQRSPTGVDGPQVRVDEADGGQAIEGPDLLLEVGRQHDVVVVPDTDVLSARQLKTTVVIADQTEIGRVPVINDPSILEAGHDVRGRVRGAVVGDDQTVVFVGLRQYGGHRLRQVVGAVVHGKAYTDLRTSRAHGVVLARATSLVGAWMARVRSSSESLSRRVGTTGEQSSSVNRPSW